MSDIQIALIIMVKGMAGIFAVTLVILLLVWLLGRIGTRNSSENPKQLNESGSCETVGMW